MFKEVHLGFMLVFILTKSVLDKFLSIAFISGPPAHPPRNTCPCCIPTLGDFGTKAPHGGSKGQS